MLLPLRRIHQWLALVLTLILIWLGINSTSMALAEEIPGSSDSFELLPDQNILNRFGVDPSNIPSEKVNQFVHACLQVVALIERREGELQGAETESESLRIQQEIEAEALDIIEAAGLTRQEYLQLLGLANTDPEFGERIAVQLQEATS